VEEILASADVAQLMKVPVGTVRYWRHIGEGPPAFKLGPKAVRYRRSQVEAWISEQESRSTGGAA
jgi:predicted DNA-binding transcriptional regulator AlpA